MSQAMLVPVLLVSLLVLAACEGTSNGRDDAPEPVPSRTEAAAPDEAAASRPSDTFPFSGTITWVDLEGGFYAIHAENGTKYNPTDLPEAMQQDGLPVKGTARLARNATSLRMYGTLIEVLEIGIR